MELSRKNLFVRYYEFIYDNEPKDICSLFWGSLIALLLAPLAVLGTYLMQRHRDFRYMSGSNRLFLSSLIAAIIYTLLAIIAAAGNRVLELFGYEFIHWTGMVFGGLGIGLSVIALIFGFIMLCWFTSDKISQYRENRRWEKEMKLAEEYKNHFALPEDKPSFWHNLKDIIAAIRGKYCIKITYKD